jgi:hypothetical protein
MAVDLQNGTEGSVSGLMTGIFHDAQELMKQQLVLLRHEVKEDVRKTAEGGASLVAGGAICVLGGLMLCFMVVYLISWAAPALPLWVCYGIVGAVIAAIGGALLYFGVRKFKSLNPVPEQSLQALKETMQWKTVPK